MPVTIEDLRLQMEAAALALDFEKAKQLRDRINLMRGGATANEASEADVTGLARQQPGAMGIGTSKPLPTPPADWATTAKAGHADDRSGATR